MRLIVHNKLVLLCLLGLLLLAMEVSLLATRLYSNPPRQEVEVSKLLERERSV